ncbi:MAG TPA: glucokinase [Nitrospiria bacterium]|nr:glucokinase [Nitrospiria bacterium]
MILAGDIGGTKTNLALFQPEDTELREIRQDTFPSKDFASLEAVIQHFLQSGGPSIHSACFGVSGPVINGKCKTTNLPWVLDAKKIGQRFGIATVILLNDLEAMAYGTLRLSEKECFALNEGQPEIKGNRCIIAAGTGLGESILFWNGSQFLASASEGGHADFAPRNSLEIRLLEFLLNRYSRVSYERILSGPGLFNIYQFLRESGQGVEPSWLKESLEREDPAEVISKAALAEQSELCVKALDLFASIYGAEAGNLALKVMATGGVYIGGGIGRKIVKKLEDGSFLKSFKEKGRMDPLMSRMPVKVILNEKSALLGAAHYANHFKLSKSS